jgi:hypothetical protein
LRLLSACVPPIKPMHNLDRKLLRTRTRQELSVPVQELQSKFPRKSVLRGPASCARNMGAHILCTLPKIATGRRKTGQ